jgi:hypothetical protein
MMPCLLGIIESHTYNGDLMGDIVCMGYTTN